MICLILSGLNIMISMDLCKYGDLHDASTLRRWGEKRSSNRERDESVEQKKEQRE